MLINRFNRLIFTPIGIPLHKFVKYFDNSKNAFYNLKFISHSGCFVLIAFFSCFINNRAKAQRQPASADSTKTLTQKIPADSLVNPSDSLALMARDSLNATDTLAQDSLVRKPVGDIKTTVHYTAKDSITLNMTTKNVEIYGDANINYTPIALEAEKVTVNWEKNLMEANGQIDSTGHKTGTPVFKDGPEEYETEQLRYNFKTEKAAIKGLVTKQGEGFVHADKVFKDPEGDLFNQTTLYTTCNLAHPHYSIKAKKVKIIPGKEMVSGPFNLIIHDVPLPIGFPFGMFPDQQHRSSGVLIPSFGEESRRGFALRNGGYYFAFNDYINLNLTGDLYTKGGWALRASSTYVKRYKFRGSLLFNFSKLKLEDENTLDINESNDFRFTWSHSPETKGTGRFSASVNIATSTYNQNNLLNDQNAQIRANLSSSVTYSKTFSGTPISIGLSGRFNQNLKTKQADILLPDFSLNVQNVYPFKSKLSTGRKWYEKVVFRYSMVATNKITNRIPTEKGDSIIPLTPGVFPQLIKQGSNGFKHTIPLSTSFRLLKQFTLTPSVNYQELWYFRKLNYTFDPEANAVVQDTIQGFNAVRSYTTSVSLNTRLYGTVFFNKKFGIQAIRHQITPSVSYSYRPDFSDPRFDYYQEVQTDNSGATKKFSRYAGFVYGQPSPGKSNSLSLSITNNLEMKYRSRKDTTGKAEKVVLLRNFGMTTGYNFAADSFKLSTISLRAQTNLFQKQDIGHSATIEGMNIQFNGTIDPYLYVLDSITIDSKGADVIHQRKIDQFAWNNGQGLGRLSRYSLSFGTTLRAKTSSGSGSNVTLKDTPTHNEKEASDLQDIIDNPENYVDFKIPWSLRVNYNMNFSRIGFKEGKITQSLRFSGDLSLTEKWKVTFNSGYDFERDQFTETRLGITRDLHCWEMRLDWVPYGRFQSYNFVIRVKSSMLQDLKLTKRRNATDSFTF